MLDTELERAFNVPFTFKRRPVSLPGDMRPVWRLHVLVLLLEQCWGGKATHQQLHVLNWAIKTEETRVAFLQFIQGHRAPNQIIVRYDPSLIRDQMGTFGKMLNDVDEVIEAKESDVEAIMNRIKDLNALIRALKKTLKSDGRIPSVAAVQEQLQIDARLLVVQGVIVKFEEIMKALKGLSDEWGTVQGRLKTLADVNLSADDERKLKHLESSFVAQLREYNFSSFPIEEIGIGRESYRPSRDGYDIGLTSASDTIRMIWAYLLGMLEVGRKEKTNHLGFVVFDEPRQQGAEAPSFDALLRRAEESGNVGQQVIFTTSDEKSLLENILKDLDCNYVRFDGKVLRPIETASVEEVVAEEPEDEPEEPEEQDGSGGRFLDL
jgi:hypothetical protein